MFKFTARILSIVMLFTSISTNYNYTMFEKEVYANTNDVSFNTSFAKALNVGPMDSVPIESTTTEADTVWLEWDMNNFNEGTFSSGDFTLSYPIEDGQEVRFTVEKEEDNKAIVTYRMYSTETGEPLPTFNNGYLIYSHKLNSYLNFNNYITGGHNSSIENYQVLEEDALGNQIDYPRFVIETNTGFSFKYNNVDVHFKWNEFSNENKMYFYTNKLKKGYVVEPKLNVKVGNTSKDYKKLISSGISASGFRALPYGNGDKYSSDIIFVEGDTGAFPSNDNEERGLDISFKSLKAWDETTNSFTANTGKVPVSIRLTSLEDSESMTVKIDDISSQSNASLIATNPKISLTDYEQVDDEVKFKLKGLKDGIIYQTTIEVLPDLSIVNEDLRLASNNTTIEFGKVFTFPKYEIITQNGKLYIIASPFYGYSGEFLLKTGISERASSRQQSDGVATLIFPLAINSQNMFTEYYRLYFSPGRVFENTASANTSNTIHSQKLHYTPSKDTSGVTMPNNFYVIEANHIKDDSVSDFSKGFLEVTYRWDIGIKDDIDKMFDENNSINITYDLSKNLDPTSLLVDKVAEMNLNIQDIDGELFITYSGGDDGELEDSLANYVVNTEQELLKYEYQEDTNDNVYYAEVKLMFKTAISNYSGLDIGEIYFRYPNIYFFTVKPTKLNGEDINMSSSIFKSVTLNYLESLDLNPPQNVHLTDNIYTSVELEDSKDEVSFKTNFTLSGQSMKKYLMNLYLSDEIDKVLDSNKFSAYFNIYLTQEQSKLTNNFNNYINNEPNNNLEVITYNSSLGDELYLSNINGNTPLTTNSGKVSIDTLRSGEVLKIEKYPVSSDVLEAVLNTGRNNSYSIKFDGLDSNTQYYLAVDLVVEDFEKDYLEYSEISPINAITTKGKLDVLNPSEVIPNAPDFFVIDSNTDKAMIGWNSVTQLLSEDENIQMEYELIRLKDNPMDDLYLDTRDAFTTTWNDYIDNDNKVGFRTSDANILIYDNDFVSSNSELYQYSGTTTPITLTDQTLIPNTIYYYYIRTVKIIDGVELYSVWERVTVTTSNIEGPINLEAMFDEYDSNIDLKSQVYLKFDAPIKDLSQLGTVYNLELSTLKDAGTWQQPVVISPSSLTTDGVINEEGYRNFIYKVTNLEPGTTYSFRVRLSLIGENSSSIYSNTVRIRTNVDGDDYDEEEKVDDWSNYIKDALEEILNGDYWETTNTNSNREIIYRESKFDGMLKAVNDGFLTLVDAEENKYNHYYIPVSSLIKANNQKVGFKIKSGDVVVTLSNNAIDTSLNNSLKPLAIDIKDGDIKDYYLDIIVKTVTTTEKINGNTISSPVIEMKVVTTAFSNDIEQFEVSVFEILAQDFINKELPEEVIEKIEKLLKDDKSNEDIIKDLKSEIKSYTKDTMEEVDKLFDKNTSANKYNREIALFDEPILISNPKKDTKNKSEGYKQVGNTWVKERLSTFGTDDMIVTYTGGTYVFTSTSIIINDIGNIQEATKAHEVLVKYDLYDILKDNNGINANKVITRNEAYQSIAKILGNKGTDSISYLKSLGIDVTTRNTSSPITEEELVYLLMNIYEYKSNTKTNNYQIRNYNKVANINNVNSRYLKAIQVAVDLDIVDVASFNSKEQVTMEKFLNTILNIGSKVGI